MKLNGTGLSLASYNFERELWADGFGMSDSLLMTVLQWYMSPSMADSVVSRAAHGMDFDVDDLQDWFDTFGDVMEDEHYQIVDAWLTDWRYTHPEHAS